MLSTIRNCIKQMTIKKYADRKESIEMFSQQQPTQQQTFLWFQDKIKKYADRKESIEMFSKAIQSLHYTANKTTDFSCLYFRLRSRNTPSRRRAMKCSARPYSLHDTANSTTYFFCVFRTRSRNTPTARRALKCSATSVCVRWTPFSAVP